MSAQINEGWIIKMTNALDRMTMGPRLWVDSCSCGLQMNAGSKQIICRSALVGPYPKGNRKWKTEEDTSDIAEENHDPIVFHCHFDGCAHRREANQAQWKRRA